MRRKIYDQLLAWKQKDSRRVALLIDGARRVGKSYIAEEFGKNEYETYLLIDFRSAGEQIKELFRNSLDHLDTLFLGLSTYYNVRLLPGKSLIIFDEIQFFPRAREAIKFLVQDGRFDYLETGSLVSINENVKDIQIPSEERHLKMYPMDFEEFLWAVGNDTLMPALNTAFSSQMAIPNTLHRRAMELLRQYLVVGGMPQAVEAFVQTQDLGETDRVKRDILGLYKADIAKHTGRYKLKVQDIFDAIPSQLTRHDKIFHLSSLDKNARRRNYEDAFLWLEDAQIVNMAFNSTEPNLGLKLNSDRTTFKLYMNDTGLLISHAFDENALASEAIHRQIMFDRLEVNLGMIVENLVAQMLTAKGQKLYFYSTSANESPEDRMEIDFLTAKSSISSRKNISPIEVKSGKHFMTTSLNKFRTKFNDYLEKSYVIHTGAFAVKDGITMLPLYMVPCM